MAHCAPMEKKKKTSARKIRARRVCTKGRVYRDDDIGYVLGVEWAFKSRIAFVLRALEGKRAVLLL